MLREERLRYHAAAQGVVGSGHAGGPGGRDLFQGERRRSARYHAPVRPDMAKAHGVAGARHGLRRPAAALGRVFLVAHRIPHAYPGSLRRQSPDERWLLDGAAHGYQSNRRVSVAVCLAGPLVGGLFLQCSSAVWLATNGLGGREGADSARTLRGRRPAGRALVPHAQAAVLLPGFLFRGTGPDVESGDSYRQHHGRAVRLSAFHRSGRVRGGGPLRVWPAGHAPARSGHADHVDCARVPVPGICCADLRPEPRLAR